MTTALAPPQTWSLLTAVPQDLPPHAASAASQVVVLLNAVRCVSYLIRTQLLVPSFSHVLHRVLIYLQRVNAERTEN